MPQSRRSTRAAGEFLDTPDNSDILVKPSWDTSDNSLPEFLEALYKYLPKKDPRYRNWVEFRYVVSGRYTNTVSFNHIDRLINHSIVKGTFAAPRIILSTDMESYGTDADGDALEGPMGPSVVAGAPALPNYTVNEEAGALIDTTMCDDILDCIDDEDTIDDLRDEANGNGAELLINLKTRRDQPTPQTTARCV